VTAKKNNIFIDSENSLIFSTVEKPIAAIGLKNIVVINTENGVLVADMNELQKVKTVIQELK
jgi:mannose-1-phosphate guanylyltransferase